MTHTVGIGDMKLSKDCQDQIITHALGSCLGITVFDPVAKVGGLVHVQLPLSKIDREKASLQPCKFVDTGVPSLFRAAYQMGAQKERLIVKVAGGSKILDTNNKFRIGERNYQVLRKILWKNGISIEKEDVGGEKSRTMSMQVETGQVTIKSQNETIAL